MISVEQKRKGTNLKKASSTSMVTPLSKEEQFMGRINGTVGQCARFEIGNMKHLQQLAAVNLDR
jgi:hypothetical protein